MPHLPRLLHILLLTCTCLTVTELNAAALKQLKYSLITSQPHDKSSFTQGLVLQGDNLIESSGLYEHSFIRIYNAKNGSLVRQTQVPAQYFAEGITLFHDQLYLLTWQAGELFVLDPQTLAVQKSLFYPGQGWGITHDGEKLYTTDGSHHIRIHDPNSFKIVKQLEVIHPDNHQKLNRLNELEYARGSLWANRWMTNTVYVIDPKTGTPTGELDLTPLVPYVLRNNKEKVLNGIAYDSNKDAFWVTGKNWPVRYLLQIE